MRIRRLSKSRRGSAGITFGLAVGLIAVVAVTAVQQVGSQVSGLSNSIATKLSEATQTAPDIPAGTIVLAEANCPADFTDMTSEAYGVVYISGLHAGYVTTPATRACEAERATTLSGAILATNGREMEFWSQAAEQARSVGTVGWHDANEETSPAGLTVAMRTCPTGWAPETFNGSQTASLEVIDGNSVTDLTAPADAQFSWCAKQG